MVPIRVDRLRAAQQLDGRTWSEIAAELGTTHQRLYHLAAGKGPSLRRCRQSLRDGFARLLDVKADWLSGQTDALAAVVSADATVVALGPLDEVYRRPTLFIDSGSPLPGLQLALSRLILRAEDAINRDLQAAGEPDPGYLATLQLASLLVAASAEVGLDLVRPLPPVADADELRMSAVRHAEEIYRPWLEGRGPYPDWERIARGFMARASEDKRIEMLSRLEEVAGKNLYSAYQRLRDKKRDG